MTQYQQQPQPRLPDPFRQPKPTHAGRNAILIAVGAAVLAVVVIVAFAANKTSSGHTVVYKITGTSQAASLITYTTDGSGTAEQFSDAKIPWTKSFTIKGGLVYQVIAQNRSDQTGTVTCTIVVDGKVVNTATGDGASTIAHCVAKP